MCVHLYMCFPYILYPRYKVASFLRRELPIRLAHRIQDLERVPYMSGMPSVINVKKLYTQSFWN
jgi:hypothetical protein